MPLKNGHGSNLTNLTFLKKIIKVLFMTESHRFETG